MSNMHVLNPFQLGDLKIDKCENNQKEQKDNWESRRIAEIKCIVSYFEYITGYRFRCINWSAVGQNEYKVYCIENPDNP